jgi:hypothetical protein
MRLIPLPLRYKTVEEQFSDILVTTYQSYDISRQILDIELPILYFADHIHVRGQLTRYKLNQAIYEARPFVNQRLAYLHNETHNPSVDIRVGIQTTSTLPVVAFMQAYKNFFLDPVTRSLSLALSETSIRPTFQIMQYREESEVFYCITILAFLG